MESLADKAVEGLSIVGTDIMYLVLRLTKYWLELSPRSSDSNRFKSIKFGIKRLAKVERALERKRKTEPRRYTSLILMK